jgi:hypothetical protein
MPSFMIVWTRRPADGLPSFHGRSRAVFRRQVNRCFTGVGIAGKAVLKNPEKRGPLLRYGFCLSFLINAVFRAHSIGIAFANSGTDGLQSVVGLMMKAVASKAAGNSLQVHSDRPKDRTGNGKNQPMKCQMQ